MSELRFARLVLGLQALVWFGLALAHWFYPYEMANARGMVLMDSASVAEARVWYGGMQFALALFAVLAFRRAEWLSAGLLLVAFVQLTLFVVRLISGVLGESATAELDLYSQGYRLIIGILALLALRAHRRHEQRELENRRIYQGQ
ncbi:MULTISPECIES: DUF4345 family protein [Pseudomonas]|uniref:DUF4345 family protein n=1 Tax=Pseudomonas benzopyrenica TaxID=2993566 RepID=A0ABZ2FNR6_9PSED|nr:MULTISPECIES: DUF4345 family protein [Pseudomonas]MCD4862803.1 DUF4345 domain-containing protein [Pseudomonas sp. PLB05]MXS19713.1 DUF4345 domain-containing protein [Pseudomonas oryzihabitans]UUW71974.1 DUF4345 domain-containing protein [Pseudomonas psychrotolerans]